MTKPTAAAVAAMVERLRASRDSGMRSVGGASISADGSFKSWGGEPIMALVNPDGPAAADMLTTLSPQDASISPAQHKALLSAHLRSSGIVEWLSPPQPTASVEDEARKLLGRLFSEQGHNTLLEAVEEGRRRGIAEAEEAALGSNADLCSSAGHAYRVMLAAIRARKP